MTATARANLGEKIPECEVSPFIAARRVGEEISQLATDLKTHQHDLSELLEQAHVSHDLMQRLQALDGATQILEDLSRATLLLADAFREAPIGPVRNLADAFALGDLRSRVCGTDAGYCPDPDGVGHVNLF